MNKFIDCFHGLAAYRGGKSKDAILEKARAALQVQHGLCVSNKPVGYTGLLLKARLSAVFSHDCRSWTTPDGRRRATGRHYAFSRGKTRCVEEFFETHIYEQSVDSLLTAEEIHEANAEWSEFYCSYREGWTGAVSYATAVWVTLDAPAYFRDVAAAVAEEFGIPVKYITNRGTCDLWVENPEVLLDGGDIVEIETRIPEDDILERFGLTDADWA